MRAGMEGESVHGADAGEIGHARLNADITKASMPVLASNAQEPHIFYVLTNKGLYRSQDAGVSWQPLPMPWRDAYLNQHQQALLVTTTW